jgi:hypothetical protein
VFVVEACSLAEVVDMAKLGMEEHGFWVGTVTAKNLSVEGLLDYCKDGQTRLERPAR